MNRQDLDPQNKYAGLLPGLVLIAGVIAVRLLGTLQTLEWATLDYGLRLRPPEPIDERIIIVGIDEGDIQDLKSYPISDQDLANLLEKLQTFQPRVIGVDIFRDIPVEPGHEQLTQAFQRMSNVIAIERIVPNLKGFTISSPPELPDQQVGFADAILDSDGFLRRSLLGASNDADEYRFSFTIRLAEAYLKAEEISLNNGTHDPVAMRFGATELHRINPNTGGYIRADAAGNQILLNFRSGSKPFRKVSLRDIREGNVDPDWFQDQIVLVGVTALSQKDLINTAAVSGMTPGLIYGIEIQAHAISQIISAVLDNRPLLKTWPDVWEYLWIIIWGSVGIFLGQFTQSPTKHFGLVFLLGIGLVGLSYGSLLLGIWTPFVPTLLAFGINSSVLYAFYLYDQGLKARIQDRQLVIENTFDALHNGPLQTLATLVRQAKEQEDQPFSLSLQNLNRELREVYETVRQETLTQDSKLTLSNSLTLDLQTPLHEILYEVYTETIGRDFPCFQSLKVKVVQFDPLDSHRLSLEQKRDLCRFLEEALCNVGKYAAGVTRLTIVCGQEGDLNLIRIQDNGSGQLTDAKRKTLSSQGGRGTLQSQRLAQHLQGTFKRIPVSPKGILCELMWPIRKPPFWKRWHL